MSIIVVGTSAFDDIQTPRGKRKKIIGGSCIYFSLAASFKSRTKIISVVGKDFPREVNKNYFCDGNKLDNNQVFVLDERLVIGLFHNATKCNSQSIVAIDSHEVTGQYCELRNNAPLEEVKGGMGDIFIKMAR